MRHFTSQEARSKVGRTVKTTRRGKGALGLPVGTRGRVIEAPLWKGSQNGQARDYDVVIRWQHPVVICGRSELLVDRLTREEYQLDVTEDVCE